MLACYTSAGVDCSLAVSHFDVCVCVCVRVCFSEYVLEIKHEIRMGSICEQCDEKRPALPQELS